MRQLILIACLVATFLYGAAAFQHGVPAVAAPLATVPAPVGAQQGLGALQRALEATGAKLDEVTLTGWGKATAELSEARVQTALGWKGSVPAGEVRTVTWKEQNQTRYVVVRWRLSGKAAAQWEKQAAALAKGLGKLTSTSSYTVQVGGTTPVDGLTTLADKALGALSATDRQPWSDARAASIAGRSTSLPPGPFGVNVQVAVRRDPARNQTRVWVAWPALLQEY